jgi:hypothetical protein
MKLISRQSNHHTRIRNFKFSGLLLISTWLTLVSSAWPLAAQECTSVPVIAGYRDFNFGTTVISTPTAEKPESKLWWNDGFWWGSLWDPASNKYRIHRFDLANQCWQNVGPNIDDRSQSLCDALWDGQHLYIVSHVFSPSGTNPSRLYRYSYNPITQSYSLDNGFPVNVNQRGAEALTLAKDSTGQLWVTWQESGKVMVNRTTGDDWSWGQPFVLPVQGANLDSDDISAIIAFAGDRIGILWSNQKDVKTYFAIHLDSKADTDWEPREEALSDGGQSPLSDDHINLKLHCDSECNVYAIAKTSLAAQNTPQIYLLKRNAAGAWSRYLVARDQDGYTRPIVLIDEDNRKLYVFAKSDQSTSGTIRMKVASLDNLQFPEGLGDIFLRSGTDKDINNPTSGKHNLNSATGLLVLASDERTHHYLHNFISITGVKPLITSFTPADGPEGTEVTIRGANFTGATEVKFNGATAFYILDSATQIRATVPTGATTGKISVTSAKGTGFSATDFIVTAPPAITSFAPNEGSEGTEVTLSGSNFLGTSGVTFSGVSANFVVDSNAQIRAIVPDGAPQGGGKIGVLNSAGHALSAADFIVTIPPPIFSFAPVHDTYVRASSPTSTNGSSSTLRQRKTSSETIASYLKFNVTGLSGSVQSAKLRLYVRDASNDGGAVYVVSNNYQGTTTAWTESALNWNNAPIITGTALSAAPQGGVSLGSWVELDVTPAIVGDGIYSFGLKNASSDAVYYGSKESTTKPELIIQMAASSLFAPTIAAFMPLSGTVGSEITILGTNFNDATDVSFNGTGVTNFSIDSATQLRTTVPLNATTGKIGVTNSYGTGFSAADFIVIAPPVITSFTPEEGYEGIAVTITGINFTGTPPGGVTFNGTSASFVVDSDVQIRATVPSGASTGKISVTNAAGSAFSAADFIVTAPSLIFTFTPVHDTYVRFSSPASTNGSSSSLRQRTTSSEILHTYLKFNVTGLSGAVQRAVLRLYVIDASVDGGSVYVVSNHYEGTVTPWTESGLNWNNAPIIAGNPLSTAPQGGVSVGSWVELEVTSAITGNGIYNFGMQTTSSDAVYYSSKEGGHAPELVIQVDSIILAIPRVAAANENSALPEKFGLSSNYPNPFNSQTTIEYALPRENAVRLVIFDILGRSVRTLVDATQPAGYKRILWDGKADSGVNASSGVYFYQLQMGSQRLTQKMILQE